MAENPLMEFSEEEKEEWARYCEWLYKMDVNGRLAYAEEKGIETGIARGIETGKLEKVLETVKKMLKNNRPIEHIAEDTGLNREEILKIKNSGTD